MLDLRIRNARVLDGSGNPWFRGDVGIESGTIAAVGELTGAVARQVLDAGDAYLAPGFIDVHTHSDLTLPRFPRGESMISQGVTTEIVGNCGLTPHPVNPATLDLLKEYLAFMGGDLSWDWESTAEFLGELEGLPLSHNLLTLVGHGAIRLAAMGFERRDARAEELEAMKRSVAAAMEAGAVGLSSGLIYAPGSYGSTQELIELCRVVRRYGGVYATHLRSEADGLLDSVQEALSIGEKSGVPVQLSHHKAMGERNWGTVHASLAMVDEGRASGHDVTLDQYPYTGSSTTFTAFLPGWALEGGIPALLTRLREAELRSKIASEIDESKPMSWDRVVLATCRAGELRQYEGLTIAEIGEARRQAPVEAALDLLLAEGGPFAIVRFGMSEEDVRFVMQHPSVMVASDGNAMAPAMGGRPHPRSYGTFPRVLGQYAREVGTLSLPDAVRKMTSLPAQRFGLWGRGLIRPGLAADLVLFDAKRVEDAATFQNPHQYARGIGWVMVNGEMVWEQGADTGAAAGKVLRRQ